jgi:hypothetical protein
VAGSRPGKPTSGLRLLGITVGLQVAAVMNACLELRISVGMVESAGFYAMDASGLSVKVNRRAPTVRRGLGTISVRGTAVLPRK